MTHPNPELKAFMEALGRAQGALTRQQLTTLRGQALHGDVTGAWRGLNRIWKGTDYGNMDRAAIAYRNAHQFLRALKAHKDDVDWQQYKALREMALSGNVEGAFRALEDALAGR